MHKNSKKKSITFDAAHQIHGSSSLRSLSKRGSRTNNNPFSYNLKTTREPFHHHYDEDEYEYEASEFSHGRIVTQPHYQRHPVPYEPIPRTGSKMNYDPLQRTDIQDNLNGFGYDRYEGGSATHNGHHIANEKNENVQPVNVFDKYHHVDDEVAEEHQQDEQPCDLACIATEFLCPHSCMCVPKFTRCDGELNCENGEDEEDCKQTNEEIIKSIKSECEATEKHVMCPRTFACISQDFLCDGDDDCGDFSDETHCGAHVNCSEDQFECENGLCIPHLWVCDGDNDCKDFSDEMNCTKVA